MRRLRRYLSRPTEWLGGKSNIALLAVREHPLLPEFPLWTFVAEIFVHPIMCAGHTGENSEGNLTAPLASWLLPRVPLNSTRHPSFSSLSAWPHRTGHLLPVLAVPWGSGPAARSRTLAWHRIMLGPAVHTATPPWMWLVPSSPADHTMAPPLMWLVPSSLADRTARQRP